MSEPAHVTNRQETEQNPPVSQEELDLIRQRMKTFEEDRKAARPADEVVERLLRRHPAP